MPRQRPRGSEPGGDVNRDGDTTEQFGVLYDTASDSVVWAREFGTDVLADLATAVAEVLPTSGIAVERVGRTAGDAATARLPTRVSAATTSTAVAGLDAVASAATRGGPTM